MRWRAAKMPTMPAPHVNGLPLFYYSVMFARPHPPRVEAERNMLMPDDFLDQFCCSLQVFAASGPARRLQK